MSRKEKSTAEVQLLKALTAALPELQRHGVRRIQLSFMTVELERVEPPWPADEPAGQLPAHAGNGLDTLPEQPPPGESDDLDTAAVE